MTSTPKKKRNATTTNTVATRGWIGIRTGKRVNAYPAVALTAVRNVIEGSLMKLFIGLIIAAAVIGGFVGAEITDDDFSITGAVIGGVGVFSALMGLGAFFDSQERKRRAR